MTQNRKWLFRENDGYVLGHDEKLPQKHDLGHGCPDLTREHTMHDNHRRREELSDAMGDLLGCLAAFMLWMSIALSIFLAMR